MKLVRFTFLVALLLSISGCVIPFKYTLVQGAVGSVVDDESGRPIAGATIVVSTREGEARAVSDRDGRFDVMKKSKWGAYMVPMDPAPLPWAIEINAVGYLPHRRTEIKTVTMSRSVELGEVRLQKK